MRFTVVSVSAGSVQRGWEGVYGSKSTLAPGDQTVEGPNIVLEYVHVYTAMRIVVRVSTRALKKKKFNMTLLLLLQQLRY